jgi:CheY-like chemotaxis protein
MLNARMLVVDDDPDIHALLSSILNDAGARADCVSSGSEALARLESARYDVVLTDIRMPGLDGLELLQRIRRQCPSTPVVVMTAHHTPDYVIRSIQEKAFAYFSKPFSPAAVLDMVALALKKPPGGDDIEVLSARPGWIALRLRCKLETADRILQFIRELPIALASEERDDIAVAFRELLMNAIEHGGRLDPEQRVEAVYIRLSEAIIYYIRDPGEGFSPEGLAHAAVGNPADDPFRHVAVRQQVGMRPGGFGILMTRHIADDLMYNEKGNEVLLVKYTRRAPREAAVRSPQQL